MVHACRQVAGFLELAWARNLAVFIAYLRRRRTRAILGGFLLSSVLFVSFSGIDLGLSRLFFDHGFYMAHQAWTQWLSAAVTWWVILSVVIVTGIYAYNRVAGRNLGGVDGRKLVYLLLVLTIGAGLIVNAGFKDNFGRARPRDIQEFGGSEQFTPAFVVGSGCERNCSFSSGDSAGAFFALAFILAFGGSRAMTTAGIGFGVLVSAARIAAGAHFLSDTVVSFFVMLIVADALHYRLFLLERMHSVRVPGPRPRAHVGAIERPSVSL